VPSLVMNSSITACTMSSSKDDSGISIMDNSPAQA